MKSYFLLSLTISTLLTGGVIYSSHFFSTIQNYLLENKAISSALAYNDALVSPSLDVKVGSLSSHIPQIFSNQKSIPKKQPITQSTVVTKTLAVNTTIAKNSSVPANTANSNTANTANTASSNTASIAGESMKVKALSKLEVSITAENLSHQSIQVNSLEDKKNSIDKSNVSSKSVSQTIADNVINKFINPSHTELDSN